MAQRFRFEGGVLDGAQCVAITRELLDEPPDRVAGFDAPGLPVSADGLACVNEHPEDFGGTAYRLTRVSGGTAFYEAEH